MHREHRHGTDQATLAAITGTMPTGHTGNEHQHGTNQTSLATITGTGPISNHQHRTDQATLAGITSTVPTRPRWQGTPARERPGHSCKERTKSIRPPVEQFQKENPFSRPNPQKYATCTDQASQAGITGTAPTMARWLGSKNAPKMGNYAKNNAIKDSD